MAIVGSMLLAVDSIGRRFSGDPGIFLSHSGMSRDDGIPHGVGRTENASSGWVAVGDPIDYVREMSQRHEPITAKDR